MEKIRLGRTNLNVIRLGFGGIPIQRISEGEAIKAVKRAIELGVDFIDTARRYTDSEGKIGKALKTVSKRVYLASKSPAREAQGIVEDLKASLEKLGVSKIDLYQLHNVSSFNAYKQILAPNGALEGLKEARAKGLIDFIGITSHNLDVLLEAVKSNQFDTIMLCFNFIENLALEKVIPLAKKKDLGIIAMKPFAGGVLTEANLALKYVLSFDSILPIPGMESIEEVEENFKVFLEEHLISKEEEGKIKRLKEELGGIFCRRCDYCQPCEQAIPIATMLHMKSVVKRMGAKRLTFGWAAEAIEKARKCTQCGTCEERCPYNLPIPRLIEENLKYVDQELSGLITSE